MGFELIAEITEGGFHGQTANRLEAKTTHPLALRTSGYVRTGVSESDRFVRYKKRSCTSVQTQIGDIREDLWYQLAEQVIGCMGDVTSWEVLEVWCRKRCIVQGMALICTRRRWSCTATGYSTVRKMIVIKNSSVKLYQHIVVINRLFREGTTYFRSRGFPAAD